MTKNKKVDYIYTVGRRKSAAARIRLFRGKGENTVNGMPISKYFPGDINHDTWTKPLKVLDVSDKYYFSARVVGGGKQGQIEAITLGLSRALAKESAEIFRKPLKDNGLLKRDERVRERRKPGTGGRARRKKQSPKR